MGVHGLDHEFGAVLATQLLQARERLTTALTDAVHRELSDVQDRLLVACTCALERTLQGRESVELEELRTEIAELRAELAQGPGTGAAGPGRAPQGGAAGPQEAAAKAAADANPPQPPRAAAPALGEAAAKAGADAKLPQPPGAAVPAPGQALGSPQEEEEEDDEESDANSAPEKEVRGKAQDAEEAFVLTRVKADEAAARVSASAVAAGAAGDDAAQRLEERAGINAQAEAALKVAKLPETRVREEAKHRAADGAQAQQHPVPVVKGGGSSASAKEPPCERAADEEADSEAAKKVQTPPGSDVKLSAKELKAMCKTVLQDQPHTGGRLWIVVGGEDTGGILVRSKKSLSSYAYPIKLARGTTIEELDVSGNRLHYRRITGDGPDFGWVNIKHNNKPLLEVEPEP